MLGLGANITSSGSLAETLPSEIGTLLYWFRHKTGVTTDGSIISGWEDQGSRGENLSQSSSGRQAPYNSSTGAIDFTSVESSGASNRLEFSSIQTMPQSFTLFFVADFQPTGLGESTDYHGFSASTDGSNLNLYDNTSDMSATYWQMTLAAGPGNNSTINQQTNPDPLTNVKTLTVISCEDADGGEISISFGGSDDSATAITGAGIVSLNGENQFSIEHVGHNAATPVRQLGGDLYEWGVYNGNLSTAQIQQLFSSMQSRGLIG
jgi:hypothetical protein